MIIAPPEDILEELESDDAYLAPFDRKSSASSCSSRALQSILAPRPSVEERASARTGESKFSVSISQKLGERVASFNSRSCSLISRGDSCNSANRNNSFSGEKLSLDGRLTERLSSFDGGRFRSLASGGAKFSSPRRYSVSGKHCSPSVTSGIKLNIDEVFCDQPAFDTSGEPLRRQADKPQDPKHFVSRLLSTDPFVSFPDGTSRTNTRKNRSKTGVSQHLAAMAELSNEGKMSPNKKLDTDALYAILKKLPEKNPRVSFCDSPEVIPWDPSLPTELNILDYMSNHLRPNQMMVHGKLVLDACLGQEIVQCLAQCIYTTDREDARELACDLLAAEKLVHAFGRKDSAVEDEAPYRLTTNLSLCWLVPHFPLPTLIEILKNGLPLRYGRRYGRRYAKCFYGFEFIRCLRDNLIVETLEAGQAIGTRLITFQTLSSLNPKRLQMDDQSAIYRLLPDKT